MDDADRVHTETWRLVRGYQPLTRQCLSIPLRGVSCYVEHTSAHVDEMCGSVVVFEDGTSIKAQAVVLSDLSRSWKAQYCLDMARVVRQPYISWRLSI